MTIIDPTPQITPDAPVPYTVTDAGYRAAALPALEPGFRLVPAKIGRRNTTPTIVYLPCPTFCTVDHLGKPEVAVEDVMHLGSDASVTTVSFLQRGIVHALRATIQCDPASTDPRQKAAHINVTDEDMDAALTPDMAEALADDLIGFASELRHQARIVRQFNGGDSDPDMDEALRRVRQGGAA